MSAPGDPGPHTEGGAAGPPGGRDSRSLRRSLRRAQRRRRISRLLWTAFPALAVILAVGVLFPLLVSPGGGGAGSTTTSSAPGGSDAPPPTGDATLSTAPSTGTDSPAGLAGGRVEAGAPLLVVTQDGRALLVAMVSAGPGAGVVLGLPGISLLRSGDRFARLEALYVPGRPEDLRAALASALAAPVGTVASVTWGDLRKALGVAGIELSGTEHLDANGADAALVAEALAAALGMTESDAGRRLWESLALDGDEAGFRAAVAAAVRAAPGREWTGEALAGSLVDSGAASYLEPDIASARGVVAGTGAGG
jgi:hypothetical protein